jgi:carbamoyltransferase
MIRLNGQASFELNLDYFRHHRDGISMSWASGEPVIGSLYSDKWQKLLGPARKTGGELTTQHENIAASLQAIFEEVYFTILRRAYNLTQSKKLCLAGGCAMNSVANGKIFDQTPFEDVYIQAAAGDSGTAIGAAFYAYHHVLGNPRQFVMQHAYWGPQFGDFELNGQLNRKNYKKIEGEEELCHLTAQAIANGKVVGWFQGRMEWGARALGNRSILADPRRSNMKDILNARIKRREPFRPFAPSILEEAVGDYFERSYPDPFMIKVYPIRKEKRETIPAVTHVDGTGRLQTVSRKENPLYWKLIKAFEKLTGVPVILNTSFNENEPIVCTPKEALECFQRTKMDVLVLGNYFIEKTEG